MLWEFYCGRVFYEIIYDKKEPYILDWQIGEIEMLSDGLYLPDKYIGASLINESMIGTVVFFSYEEARERLNFIRKDGL